MTLSDTRRKMLGSSLAIAVLAMPSVSVGQSYTVTDLGTLGSETYGVAINQSGRVVGFSLTKDAVNHAFIWIDGVMTDLGTNGLVHSNAKDINGSNEVVGRAFTPPSTTQAILWNPEPIHIDLLNDAHAINNAGLIAGRATSASGFAVAAIWDRGNIIEIEPPKGYCESSGVDINKHGSVAGWLASSDADCNKVAPDTAFLWADGQMTILGTLEGATGTPCALNDLNQVVGIAGGTHPVLWDGDKVIDLEGLPGANWSQARGINNRTQIVGRSQGADGCLKHKGGCAWLWQDGRITNLQDLVSPDSGWYFVDATDINDCGEIVGTGYTKDGRRGFLLTPVDGVPGDLDDNCTVGVKDLLILLGNWGPCGDCNNCLADLDDDCVVGVSDLLILLGNWG